MRITLPLMAAHRITRRGPWYFLAGLALLAAAVVWLRGFGFATGLMLALFGLAGFSFRFWLRERGLWMLAALALMAYVPLAVALQMDAWKRNLNGNGPWWAAIDGTLAAAVVWRTIRFLATIARVNRQLSRAAAIVSGLSERSP